MAICNVVGSMITREAAGTIYTHAGPEIGVASTKAFTAQLTALYLFALYLAQVRGTINAEQAKEAHGRTHVVSRASSKQILTHEEDFEDLAKQYSRRSGFPVPRSRHPLPHRARRRSEAERDFLYPRRRLSRRAR